MRITDLSMDWTLRQEPLFADREAAARILRADEGWIPVASLPCDVHVPLIERGEIPEPLVGEGYEACRWIEDRSWWFRKEFVAGADMRGAHSAELVLEGLDVEADLFLNGTWLGAHRDSFYPFRADVRRFLTDGLNTLLVRLTTGLERVSKLDLAAIDDFISCEYRGGRGPRGDERRALLRKPQFVFGWDWSPRLATCGIMGGARIETRGKLAIRSVRFTTEALNGSDAKVRVTAEIDHLDPVATADTVARVEIRRDGAVAASEERDVLLRSGLNFIRFDLEVRDAALWWPNGMGAQSLYDVRVDVEDESAEIRAGIRTITVDRSRSTDGGRMFAFVVNGIRTFCKGGNWETPDALYGRIPDDKYETLVREARDANFNMFRVNGVNAYERDFFYECCDRYGILVWQDFMGFSCAAYPDELDWFRTEAEREIDFQSKRLRSHACLALWCGNNECHAHLMGYKGKVFFKGPAYPSSPGGTYVYNHLMPRVLEANCPEIFYWNSSPYGGTVNLDCAEYGDQHHWVFMDAKMEKRIAPERYDRVRSKFVSEFGCVGPTKRSSIVRYLGTEEIDTGGPAWRSHTNTFEKDTLRAGIAKHFADPDGLGLDEALLYGGLFQGLMLGHAIESMRVIPDCFGSLIWSYDDAWGEAGWSVVDHYLVRKISYDFVRRAMAHKRLILRPDGDSVRVFCANDSPDALEFRLECGHWRFDGTAEPLFDGVVRVSPFTKAVEVCRVPKGSRDPRFGLFYARADGRTGILPATLREEDHRNLSPGKASLRISDFERGDGTVSFSVTSDRFAFAVRFGLRDDIRLSDESFDLLPGETRRITMVGSGLPDSIGAIRPRCLNDA